MIDDKKQSLAAFLAELPAGRLGTLAFNLSAFAWIGLNIAFFEGQAVYLPGAYLEPNWLNYISALVLLYSSYLALRAIGRGSLLPAVITLSFLWSVCGTITRNLMQ